MDSLGNSELVFGTGNALPTVLDLTLPPELRSVVQFGPVSTAAHAANQGTKQPAAEAATDQAAGALPATSTATDSSSPPISTTNEEKFMDPKILTLDEVKAAAAQVVQELAAAKDRDSALASKFQDLMTQANDARREAAELKTQLETAQANLGKVQKDLETANQAATAAQASVSEKDKELAKAQGSIEQLNKQLGESAKKLVDIAAEKTIASRTQALKDSGLSSDARVARASARKTDGSFELSDEIFDGWVKELKEIFEAGKAAVASQTQANTTQTDPTKVTASTNATTQTDKPAAGPDLSGTDLYAKATAALIAGGGTATPEGKSTMAQVFGAI